MVKSVFKVKVVHIKIFLPRNSFNAFYSVNSMQNNSCGTNLSSQIYIFLHFFIFFITDYKMLFKFAKMTGSLQVNLSLFNS